MDEEAGEVRPAAAFELETEPTPAHGRKQTGWWHPPSGVTGGAVGVALVLLLLSGVATSRWGGGGRAGGGGGAGGGWVGNGGDRGYVHESRTPPSWTRASRVR